LDWREERRGIGASGYHVNADQISRRSRYSDTEGELRFLADRNFISYDEPEEEYLKSGYWRIHFPGAKNEYFEEAFLDAIETHQLEMRSLLLTLDLSVFDG
jgi:hypothetical protein